MTRLIIGAAGAVGLILFMAFVASRLVRARRLGISIRMQVFLALASVVGAFALGLGLLVIDRVQARATRIAEESAQAEAKVIAAVVEADMEARGVSLRDAATRITRSGDGVSNVEIGDAEGRRVVRGDPAPEGGLVYARAPIAVGGETVGFAVVGKPTIVIEGLLADVAPTVLLLSVVLGAAAALSATVIGRAIAAPIERLTDFAVRVSEGQRRAAPPPTFGREVQRLSRAIDSMRRELEGRPFVETFAADLSHELKNPVAAIRASAEVLADGALEEPEQAARFVHRIQESSGRIEALLGDLLSLARIEARGVEDHDSVDVVEICRGAAKDAGTGFDLQLEGVARVRGDATWLGRGIDNLLHNALTYGQAPRRLSVRRQGGDVLITVENDGAISPHVAKNLFKRFVTTRANRGGTGLGLAIVRAVAEAHGGTAECLEPGPPSVRFRITLPAA